MPSATRYSQAQSSTSTMRLYFDSRTRPIVRPASASCARRLRDGPGQRCHPARADSLARYARDTSLPTLSCPCLIAPSQGNRRRLRVRGSESQVPAVSQYNRSARPGCSVCAEASLESEEGCAGSNERTGYRAALAQEHDQDDQGDRDSDEPKKNGHVFSFRRFKYDVSKCRHEGRRLLWLQGWRKKRPVTATL